MQNKNVCAENDIPLVLASIHQFITNKKWKNKVYKLLEGDDRIPILQVAGSKSKRQKETEKYIKKDGFKPSSRID